MVIDECDVCTLASTTATDIFTTELLAPLTSAAQLAHHPSLSIPFTATALTDMAENARESLHRERQILWGMKKLLLTFRGDDPWVPVGKMEAPHDLLLLNPHALGTAPQSLANETEPSLNETASSGENPLPQVLDTSATTPVVATGIHDMTSNGIQSADMALDPSPARFGTVAETVAQTHPVKSPSPLQSSVQLDNATTDEPASSILRRDDVVGSDIASAPTPKSTEPASPADSNSNGIQHRMTTRARARTPTSPTHMGSPSPSPATSSIPPVHGFFNVPPLALPDRDNGLPSSGAEDTRRLLILFVLKQDQVVREAEHMFEGLLKAERMRNDVLRWSKAEAHVGELSDGEDWYDKDEWKLDTDLLKGKEEEEIEEEGRGKGRRRRGAQH